MRWVRQQNVLASPSFYYALASLQRAVASILKEVLGDLLFIPKPQDMGATWLSPAQLQRKVGPGWVVCTGLLLWACILIPSKQ
jgi:hypothetical protein